MRWLLFAIAMESLAFAQDPYCAKYPETKFCIEKTIPKVSEDSAIVMPNDSAESQTSPDSQREVETEEYACRFNADSLLLWSIDDMVELDTFVQQDLGAAYEELARLESRELTSMQRDAIRLKVDNAIQKIVKSRKTFTLGRWMVSDVLEFEKRELNAAGEKYKATLLKFVNPWDMGAVFNASMQLGACAECWKKPQKWYKVVLLQSNVKDSRLSIVPSGAVVRAKLTVETKSKKMATNIQRNTLLDIRGKITEMTLGIGDSYSDYDRPLFCPDVRFPGEGRNKFGGRVAERIRELTLTVEIE